MSSGTIIKKLRFDRGMTQERLAEILSISPQAVSRWECDMAMPDISLLPALAYLFDVTTDYLLGVDVTRKEKEIEEICRRASDFSAAAHSEEAVDVLREGLKRHPMSYKIMLELAYALDSCCDGMHLDDAQREEKVREIFGILEDVLAHSTDSPLRHDAAQLLVYCYCELGKPEKAQELAQTMPYMHQCREELMAYPLRGTAYYRQTRRLICRHLDELLMHLEDNAVLDDGTVVFSAEEQIELRKKKLALIELLIDDGNYGFFRQTYSWTALDIAHLCAQIGRTADAFAYLELAKVHAIIHDETYDPHDEYTCLVFRGREHGKVFRNSRWNDSLHQLKEMEGSVFDGIRDTAEFRAIEDELKRHAAER